MSKARLNLLIDTLAYFGMVILLSTGLLLMYIMPPGTGGCHGADGARVTLLGLSRHQWGAVHWYVALGLIAIAAIHVLLHWRWVVSTLGGLLRSATTQGAGRGGALPVTVLGLVGAGLIAAPWIVGAETHPTRGGGGQRRHGQAQAASPCDTCTAACPLSGLTAKDSAATPETCDDPNCKECRKATQGTAAKQTGTEEAGRRGQAINGQTTLAEAAALAGVPVDRLATELKLPAGTPPDSRLGHLRQEHGLTMRSVRDAVAKLKAAPASGVR